MNILYKLNDLNIWYNRKETDMINEFVKNIRVIFNKDSYHLLFRL